MPTTLQQGNHVAAWYRFVSWLFAREPVPQAVATRIHFNATPEVVWHHLKFYEEVSGRPPFLLRALLPHPVGTEGDKTLVGAAVRCTYKGGSLLKRITAVEPPRYLQFEVVEQCLGIESCILTLGGSYRVSPCADSTDVVLTTNYEAYLRPRSLWRPLEAALVSQLHRYIFRGLCTSVLPDIPPMRSADSKSRRPQRVPSGGLACTASQSCSRR